MLLLLLPAIFRGKINFPNKIVVYVYPLYAVAAGFVSFMDNDLFHELMQKLRCQLCRLGVLLYDFQKTLNITSVNPSVVWTYFHGILSEISEPREALVYAQKYLVQQGLVIDHLSEHKWNNHLYALAAMPRDSNTSFGVLRTRIRYPCYFHVVYDHDRGVYKARCGIDRKKYAKRFVFGDLTSEAECTRLKDCLREFRTAVRGKGFTLERPGDDNLLFRAGHEKALDYHMPALERMVQERLSMYGQYETGCFKDVSKLLKTQLKKHGTDTLAPHGGRLTDLVTICCPLQMHQW